MISHGFAYFLGLIADIAVANPRRAPQRVCASVYCSNSGDGQFFWRKFAPNFVIFFFDDIVEESTPRAVESMSEHNFLRCR